MRPFGQAAIWGLVNSAAYGLSAGTIYPNSIAPDPMDRWAFGAVAFGSVLVASTLAGWQAIRARKGTPVAAWRASGVASCVVAGLVYAPVLYWVTMTAYSWYARDHGSADGALMTFLGGLLVLPVTGAVIFFVVIVVSEGLSRLKLRVVGAVVPRRRK